MEWLIGANVVVIAVIALLSTLGWIATSWIRAKHGYPLENEWSGVVYKGEQPESARQVELLANENSSMKAQMGRLEERIAVLERIATDPAERTAREIEHLRQAHN
jgi:hypothetical protein